jgi:hypothetical protein
LHESVVHTFPSSQLIGVPLQTPPEHTSFPVQAFPSLQVTLLLVCVQPVAGLQASVVQTFPSSQFGGGPPVQVPPTHVSPVVQRFPSLHELLLLANTQPVVGLHVSVVQPFPSSQFGGGPPVQVPLTHVSPVVQALPSLQAFVLLTCLQPTAGSHESVVHGFPSSQLSVGPPTHVPPEHASPVVQAFPSLQELLLFTCLQPAVGSHESVVQTLPSLHEALLSVCVQPAWVQASVVQALPSLQLGGVPGWQPNVG